MPSTYVFTLSPYNKSDIPLGGIVIDAKVPTQDFIGQTAPDQNISMSIDENFTGNAQNESKTSFQWLISMIMSIFWNVESEDSLEVTADEARIYSLLQQKAVFEELCAQEETQQWLKYCCREGENPMFVVGYRTLLNAKLVRKTHYDTSIAGKVQVSPALAAGLPDSDATRVEASASYHDGSKGTLEFDARGERVFAICYRKIKFRYHSGKVDVSLRKGNLWKLSSNRGKVSEDVKLVEAVLEDESGWAENEVSSKIEIADDIFVSLLKEDA
jgi:hypothetical protein